MTFQRWVASGLVVFLMASSLIGGERGEGEWKALMERAAKGEKNTTALREDLLRFRQRYFGTPQAVLAAGLLRDLISPLDQLDAKNIPDLEKFAWFPKETVAVLGEHRGRQGGAVTGLAWSKNDKWLASTSTNGLVRLWDPTTMRLLHTMGHSQGGYCAVFSKDNSLLLHGGGDGQVLIVDMTTDPPKLKESCKVASTPLLGLAVGPKDQWFVTGGSDTRLCMWDLTTNPPSELSAGNAHTGAIHSVIISQDGKTIVSAGADKMIRIWSFTNNRLTEKSFLEAHAGAVLTLAWSPGDEKTLASGGADGAIRVWNLIAGKLTMRFQLKGTGGAVNSLAFSPSGKTLAAAGADGIVRTYTVAASGALAEKSQLEGHLQPATAVAFAPDASNLATAGHDWTVRLWPTVTGPRPKDKTIKSGHLSHVYTVAFAPDEKGLASGSYDTAIRFWDLPASLPKERLPVMKGNHAIYTLAFAPDSKSLAAGGNSGKFQTYDPATARSLFTFTGHQGAVNRLVFHPDGKVLASVAADKSLRLWNPKTGLETNAITTFENYINGAAFSPDGQNLLCCSGYYLRDDKGNIVYKNSLPLFADSTVRLYETFFFKETYRWKTDLILPSSVAFSADGKHFFAGAHDGMLRRWETSAPAAEPEVFHKGSATGISQMVCSPDGRWLATYGPDYRVNLFDPASGKIMRSWATGEQFASLAFAMDSRHLAISLSTGVTLILRLENAR
jgi:WD40 repeat protein